VAEQLTTEPDPATRELLRRAAAHTVPPGPFDVSTALHGGRRRLARRRMATAAGVATVAVLAAGIALVPGLGDDRAAPPADPTPSPTAVEDRQLERLLRDPDALLGHTTFDGAERSVTSLRRCDQSDACAAAVLLTADGWASGVAHRVPGASAPWTQLLPDGSAAVVPDDAADSFVLDPDGSSVPLTVSTDPGPATDDSVLVGGFKGSGLDLWVLDPEQATLRPLATPPPGDLRGPVTRVSDGSLVVPVDTTSQMYSLEPYALARSRDNGRTWTLRTAAQPDDPDTLRLSGWAIGPDGQVAVHFSPDGATISPWGELWLSRDSGRTWHRIRPTRHPSTVSGMAFGPHGTLLLTDHETTEMWRVAAGDGDLEPAPGSPPAATVYASGGMLVAHSFGRTLTVSADESSWRHVAPGRSASVAPVPKR
jgi:hypothetical protein